MSLFKHNFGCRSRYNRFGKEKKRLANNQFKYRTAILGSENSGRLEVMHNLRLICRTYSFLQKLILKENIANKALDSLYRILMEMKKNDVDFVSKEAQDLAEVYESRRLECRGHRGLRKLVGIMLILWNDQNMQKYFNDKNVDKSAAHFLMSLGKISSEDYVPNDYDIYIYSNVDIPDSESNQSFQTFEGVYEDIRRKFIAIDEQEMLEETFIKKIRKCHYIVFFVNLSDFDLLIQTENGQMNALIATMNKISQLLSIQNFDKKAYGLLFTGVDLLHEKLKTIDFRQYFPDFIGVNDVREVYNSIYYMFSKQFMIDCIINTGFMYMNEFSPNDPNKIREELLSTEIAKLVLKYEQFR